MACAATDDEVLPLKENNLKEKKSSIDFQKFIYELFEKNGILNDLRAYLRGHIIDVLKSAQNGEAPACQKNFTKRLELLYQAMNIIIAEYLLRLNFSYSLSVFVSEIPLANMVFDFAKKLMKSNDGDFEMLKFNDNDICSILNYLGLKCDSEYANNVIFMYRKESLPLLMCILQCTPMNRGDPIGVFIEKGNISSESLCSSIKICDSSEGRRMKFAPKNASHIRCRHSVSCKSCQSKINRLKDKYKTKKNNLKKNSKSMDIQGIDVKTFMRNIDQTEESLVTEMFQQLKEVYEAEVNMVRLDEEKKIKRSLASHALQLQRKKDEMEESFKAREAELERNIQDKKKFLWGLARALRDQHASMARAMHAVKCEAESLTAKEDNLKSQLLSAEEMIRKRGEEMRKQISDELSLLERYLEDLKVERDSINKERTELEQLKNNNNIDFENTPKDSAIRAYYDSLKDELVILKKYIENTKLEPKCVIERSTSTDLNDITSEVNLVLNNEQDADRTPLKSESDEKLRTPNKVVNDLKKQKNVNFCTANVDELYRECSREASESSASSETGEAKPREAAGQHDLVERLREENERLKEFARQQSEHIEQLSSQRVIRTERPRTAPAMMPRHVPHSIERLNTSMSSNSVGWRKGAGEEMSCFVTPTRIVLPGDSVPFVGVVCDRKTDNRRHLINQWQALRRRMSPAGVSNLHTRPSVHRDTSQTNTLNMARNLSSERTHREDAARYVPMDEYSFRSLARERPKMATLVKSHEPREKSPKTVLIEAKEKLRNNNFTREHPTRKISRVKSPNSVLKEAKLRLRKLEIEAEAVEKSYLDFRRRQSELMQHRIGNHHEDMERTGEGYLDVQTRLSHHNKDLTRGNEKRLIFGETLPTADFSTYRTEFRTMFPNSQLNNLNTCYTNAQPIPSAFSKIEEDIKQTQKRRNYYLETPLTEFRKLYHSQDLCNSGKPKTDGTRSINEIDINDTHASILKDISLKTATGRENELEILKSNIKKMYNIKSEHETEVDALINNIPEEIINKKDNLEEVVESKIVLEPDETVDDDEPSHHRELHVVVENTINTEDIDLSQTKLQYEEISTQMTIIVSPKRVNEADVVKEPEKKHPVTETILPTNDVLNAIFHSDKVQSSVDTGLNESKEKVDEVLSGDDNVDDYPDDFSADVDNYNSRSEYGPNSPISLPKNSEDDNFWDS